PQDGKRGGIAGIRRARVRCRHAHPPPGVAMGPVIRQKRRANRARPEEALPTRRMGEAPPADDLLRPRALPRPQSQLRRLPDLLLGRAEESARVAAHWINVPPVRFSWSPNPKNE